FLNCSINDENVDIQRRFNAQAKSLSVHPNDEEDVDNTESSRTSESAIKDKPKFNLIEFQNIVLSIKDSD
ncbi:4449_t:CDS:2, partial [Paraglomus brasilianum]